jgi:mono/diheme cytochrome c family protein
MSKNRFRMSGWGSVVLVAALLCALPARAAEKDIAKAMYDRYCASCHGTDGKGDGALRNFLTTKPTDLTHLTKQAGGQFPFVRVMQIVDGTEPIRAHGSSDMPVWGETFRRQSGSTPAEEAEVRGKLMLITEYIRAIQAK